MATSDSVFNRQQQLFGVISRAVENLRKLGLSKLTLGTVQSRTEALKSNWDKFQNNHDVLLKAASSEQRKMPYFKDDLYSKCEEEFLNAHGLMLDILNAFQQGKASNSSTDTSLNTSSVSHSRRLPGTDVPKFSGEYSQWSQFRDLFTSMIIDNSDISAVEKLHYLKMSLTGEPAQHLKNIAISGDNFNRAWDLLVARYENKRILIDAQLALLFATRKIKSESASEVKRLLADVKEALGTLEALKCPVQHWDLIITFMVVRKLDSESLKEWEETLGAQTNPATFADLENFLVSRIYSLEALERTLPQKPQATQSKSPAGTRTYAAVVAGQKCSFCDAGHYISACPTYQQKTPDQRREIINSKNLCFNCLGPHQVKACRNQKRCRTCRKLHHTTLHSTITPDAASTSPASIF